MKGNQAQYFHPRGARQISLLVHAVLSIDINLLYLGSGSNADIFSKVSITSAPKSAWKLDALSLWFTNLLTGLLTSKKGQNNGK
jgi:hypothetical protein